jgi:two-component system cell cycle sensor histidine kinase/response regulator CckA
MLERLGYAVITAKSGREATHLLHQKEIKIDVVIMDMVMPDSSPEQILKDIRNISPESKVVLTSGHDLSNMGNDNLLKKQTVFSKSPIIWKTCLESLN